MGTPAGVGGGAGFVRVARGRRPATGSQEVLDVVTAAPQDQWRLLDVQAHDTRLAQLGHKRRTLPEHAELERLQLRRRALDDELVSPRTVTSDLRRELAKAEADVEQVRTRVARNNARLQSGQGSA